MGGSKSSSGFVSKDKTKASAGAHLTNMEMQTGVTNRSKYRKTADGNKILAAPRSMIGWRCGSHLSMRSLTGSTRARSETT